MFLLPCIYYMMFVVEGLWGGEQDKAFFNVNKGEAGWTDNIESGETKWITDSSSWLKENHYQTEANITMLDGNSKRLSKPLYSLCYGCKLGQIGKSPYFNILGATIANTYKREYYTLCSVFNNFITEPQQLRSFIDV